ncbi:MAG: Gfo/Idh/MocA family oxidoreductase [Planctomycetota bacterium]
MSAVEPPVRVGLVGCGNISGIYLANAKRLPELAVVACADLVPERARAAAAAHGVPRACSPEELLADPEVEVILNLTVPCAHAAVARAVLLAGKSVYNEKPLAIRREEGRELLDLARERGLRVGGAPDTFLGGSHQTCRRLVDEGAIGVPVAATAFMVCHGHEGWHPDPAFYYEEGGGPLFDMGPYYLTALVNLLGPVRRACASARITFPARTIASEPKRGQTIRVETPTHVAGVLDFVSGAVASLVMSFDVWHASLPPIEVHGEAGSLSVPDPNAFGGPVRLRRAADREWTEVPATGGPLDNARGLGLADLARTLRTGGEPRASGELAYHVLDVMHALLESSEGGRHVEVASRCARPAAMGADSGEARP